MALGIVDLGLIFAVCILTAVMALMIARSFLRSGRADAKPASLGAIRMIGSRIVECDPAFETRLNREGWSQKPADLRPFFDFRFADLPDGFPLLDTDGSQIFHPHDADDTGELTITRRGTVTSILLRDGDVSDAMAHHIDQYRDHTRQLNLWILSQAAEPTWITDATGRVTWSNLAYQALAQLAPDHDGCDASVLGTTSDPASYADRHQGREKFTPNDGTPDRWYDVSRKAHKGITLYQAVDVTAVVKAETAQRTFVQTLTKTFAQLSTGLAIFDRNLQLALFNPALIDLTGLSPEFLSARPGHLTFFDKLRDEKIMPEPRNYGSWRDQIIDLIAKAQDGQYQETWSLPDGFTYRITGRPHPNGAVAFLIEDISAEVTLTRRFREQLDLSQAVLDSLDDALAVFSPQGVLSYTNDAYRQLWSVEGAGALDQKVADVSRQWQTLCGPDPTWGDFRDFAVGFGDRCEWDSRVRMRDGRTLDCRFKPLQGGATLATFRVAAVGNLREIRYQ